MKIVQFAASPKFGGAEKSFVELASALAELHDVTALLARGCSYQQRFSEKVNLVELQSGRSRYNPALNVEIYRNLKAIAPDIVHTHTAKSALLVKQVNRLLGLCHVATKRNDRTGRVFNSLDRIVAVSEKVRRSIKLKKGAVCSVIYNGSPVKTIVQRPLEETFTLLAVGRLDKIKGFDLLIRQVEKLNFPFRLLIVGEGPEQAALAELIRELGLTESVFLTGFRDDIAQMMHEAHAVVISSYREGFSNVLAEAFFYGRVLLATPVGVVPEVLPKEFQAGQADLAVKITHLFHNYQQYSERFERSKEEKKELFELKTMVKSYEAFYRKVLES